MQEGKTSTKTQKINFYIAYTAIFIVSILLAIFLPIGEIFKDIMAIPVAAALLAILYQLYKDQRVHEHNIEIQNKQQDFALSVASHMADVTYDKHVMFCEEYTNRVQEGFQELLRDGVSKNSIKIGGDLIRIRQKHSPWLTKEIEIALNPFEQTLIKIGAKNDLINVLPIGEQRTKIIDDVYRSFGLILGHEKPLNEEETGLAINEVIEKIRDILGINILTELRLKTAELALKRVIKQ